MNDTIQPHLNLTTPQQPLTSHLSPEQFTALWQKCTTNNPSVFTRYLSTLSPLKPSPADLNHCLSTALSYGPHYAVMQHLITQHNVPVSGNMLVDAVQMAIPISEKTTLLDFLLDEGGWDINAQVNGWNTLLNYATKDVELVKYLLNRGANPNLGPVVGVAVSMYGASQLVANSGAVLATAVREGNREVVDMLVQQGAVLANASAVHCAVEKGDEAMLVRVLGLGADVDEKDTFAVFGTRTVGTPLVRAVRENKVNMVTVLLKNGASVREKGRGGLSVVEMVKMGWVDDYIRKAVEAWAKED
ncbi:ankyrin [Zopfia rhizophila CBS 207.26]|uniref:Ankyrin n=1 Tax=Zopfia rhizophila CBS 207.26 TaxID=1314779 RepID=A0A6A6E2X9_9PEZI|nr:ankyrin [Zopfia rhizophila CBS 207.26]